MDLVKDLVTKVIRNHAISAAREIGSAMDGLATVECDYSTEKYGDVFVSVTRSTPSGFGYPSRRFRVRVVEVTE